MGKASRDKGNRQKREFARLIGGRHTPLSGAVNGYPNDVEELGMKFNVKDRKDGFKQIYKWLLSEDKPDALALKADRKPWLAVMMLEKFMKFVEEGLK